MRILSNVLMLFKERRLDLSNDQQALMVTYVYGTRTHNTRVCNNFYLPYNNDTGQVLKSFKLNSVKLLIQ